MSQNRQALLDDLRENFRELTPEQMETGIRLYVLERQRWDDPIRRCLLLFAVAIFCVSFWWMLRFLESGIDTQTVSTAWLGTSVSALGGTGSAWYLQHVFRYYFSKKEEGKN